ncbi:MAG: hypothetical protein RRB13_10500 [bacterium]|nr:hypothetical protein [bacterium]
MSALVSELKCAQPECAKTFDIQHGGLLYANVFYEAVCPHCGQTTKFRGQGGIKYHGDLTDFVKIKEVQD